MECNYWELKCFSATESWTMPMDDHYAVAVKKQLAIFYEERHELILCFFEEGVTAKP